MRLKRNESIIPLKQHPKRTYKIHQYNDEQQYNYGYQNTSQHPNSQKGCDFLVFVRSYFFDLLLFPTPPIRISP